MKRCLFNHCGDKYMITKHEQAMINAASSSTAYVVSVVTSRDLEHYINTKEWGCHAVVGECINSNYVGNVFKNYFKSEEATDLAEWLVSEDSVYYPVIKHLGNKFKVVRDSRNRVAGFYIDNTEHKNLKKIMNYKLLFNLFKMSRCFTEHADKLPFWKKWKMEKGYDPGLVYLMMFSINIKGEKISISHAPIESHFYNNKNYASYRVALNRFYFRKNNNQLDLSNTSFNSYTSENREAWGVNDKDSPQLSKILFFPHSLPKYGEKIGKTFFWGLYNKQKVELYSDETLDYFFKEGFKEYLNIPKQIEKEVLSKAKPVLKKTVKKRKKVI